jgi:hypothetical protein
MVDLQKVVTGGSMVASALAAHSVLAIVAVSIVMLVVLAAVWSIVRKWKPEQFAIVIRAWRSLDGIGASRKVNSQG